MLKSGVLAGAGQEQAAYAIEALAIRDREAYAAALAEIVGDFERRTDHLTGIPIADTALMLEVLGAARGITAGIESPLLPGAYGGFGRML